jgi:eukaryotic-like serine/threonine-protein kinase
MTAVLPPTAVPITEPPIADEPGTLPTGTLPPGTEIAPGYRVLEHIRRGADLDVYEAWSAERYCRCVLKTPRPDHAEDAGTRRHLSREARLLCRLSHPHLVRGYAWLRPQRVLVTENLPGATLAHLLDTGGRLGVQDLAQLGLHLGSALRYLHGHGVLHLDLKPGNVIAAHGVAKLIDLSLARPPGRRAPGYGTLGYMAPEQVVGARLTAATDVWGLGLVLYEAATGVAPYRLPAQPTGLSELSAYESVLVRPRYRLRAHRRLPTEAAAVIDGCLELQPGDRPPLAEVAAALESLAAG